MRMRSMVMLAVMLVTGSAVHAQLLKNIKDAVKQTAEQRTTQKAAQKSGKVVDDALDGKLFKKKKKEKNGTETEGTKSYAESNNTEMTGSKSYTIYSKYDFIPGEQVIAFEDFSADAVGDFPARWNTNASGEVVTASDRSGKWLKLDAFGVYMPEYIKVLPENFTLEMDLLCNDNFRYASSPFYFAVAALSSPAEYTSWLQGTGGREGFQVWVLPVTPAGNGGRVGYYKSGVGGEAQQQYDMDKFYGRKNSVRLSMWRQKNRIRVYLDEQKVLDVQQALGNIKYNSLVFSLNSAQTAPDHYLVSNIRLAGGLPDMRSKLMAEGRFSTSGILFDTDSDRIKPSSWPVLKEIAAILKDKGDMRIKIIGHTDSDGEAAHNKALSLKRAEAVKAALEIEFEIAAARMETDGKGEEEPAEKGDTPAARANNRRVEFVKLP